MATELLTRYRRLLAAQTARTSFLLTATWDTLGSWNEEDVDRFAHTAVPVLTGAKATVVATAAAFYARHLEVPPVAVAPAAVAVSIDPRTPFTATWHALAEQRPFDEALAAGRSVVEATTDNFLTSTARRTGDVFATNARIRVEWRRTAEPGACPWCVARDGGIYPSAESADFGHDRCHCDPVPIAA